MQKKLIAVAVAGALAAPAVALAQASTVQIYGKIRVDYNYLDSGAGLRKTDALKSYDSGVGVKGEERLGGGLSAWFQCESTIDVLGGNDGWCARNSAIGLKGAFGNVFVGNWDTPAKLASGRNRPFSTSGVFGMGSLLWNESGSNVANPTTTTTTVTITPVVGGVSTIVTFAPVTVASDNVASFTRRQKNLISWHSPDFQGFQVMLGYSAANEATGATTLALNAKPRLWSAGATFRTGPLVLSAAYENHSDYNPGGLTTYTGGDDKAWALSAGYTFAGKYKISAYYTDTKYENVSGPGADLKSKAWAIYGDLALGGPHGLRLGYTEADDVKGSSTRAVNNLAAPITAGAPTPSTGATLWVIQYVYDLSKRTELNVGYAKLNNDVNSRHRLQTAGPRNTCQGAPAGCSRDQDSFTIGIIHSF